MRINTRLSPRVQLQYRVPERRSLGTRLIPTSTYWHRVGFIDLELSWLVFVAAHPAGEQVEEGLQVAEVLSCHIGHLEDRADPGGGWGKKNRIN